MNPRPTKYQLRSGDQILFLHIPKTAGTTFYLFLAGQFSESEVWPIDASPFENKLMDRQLQNLDRYKLLRSHYDYTVYRFFNRKPVYVTMLRDPVERVISIYKHMHRDPANEVLQEVLAQQLSLEEFVQYPRAQGLAANRQVKQLAGVIQGRSRSYKNRLSTQAMLEIALMRLDEFAFFGLVERMDESIQLLCHTFNWPYQAMYESHNIAPMPSSREDLSDREIEAIEKANLLDLELYNHAVRLFDHRMSSMKETQSMMIPGVEVEPPKVALADNILLGSVPPRTLRNRVVGGLGKVRRWIIPEGSKIESKYLQFRNKYFGW